jgi:hypothetical protein
MDRRKKERYLLAVYLVVFLISIILMFIGVKLGAGDARDVILNIGTELIAVVFIFFIINKVFLVDQWNADEKISELRDLINKNKKTRALDFFKEKVLFSRFYNDAKNIELSGVTISSEINENLILFKEKVLSGENIKFLLIDPKSEIPELLNSLRNENINTNKYYDKKLDVVFEDFNYLFKSINNQRKNNKQIGKIEVRLLSYPPSFSINRFTKKSGEKNIIIEMYTHKIDHQPPPMFILNDKKDTKWFNYFSKQYDSMWERAKPWKSEIEQIKT